MLDKIIIELTPLEAEKIRTLLIYAERFILPEYDPQDHKQDLLELHEFYKNLAKKFNWSFRITKDHDGGGNA